MLGGTELKRLEFRRRELVLRSTINRLAIQVELQKIHAALRPVERIAESVRSVRPWLLVLAPLVGMFATRSFGKNGSAFSKAIRVLKWAQPIFVLWKQFLTPATEAAPKTAQAATEPGARA